MRPSKSVSHPIASLPEPRCMAQCVLTFLQVFLLLMLAGTSAMSRAQDGSMRDGPMRDWPTRAVRVIVPFPSGSGADLVARLSAGGAVGGRG